MGMVPDEHSLSPAEPPSERVAHPMEPGSSDVSELHSVDAAAKASIRTAAPAPFPEEPVAFEGDPLDQGFHAARDRLIAQFERRYLTWLVNRAGREHVPRRSDRRRGSHHALPVDGEAWATTRNHHGFLGVSLGARSHRLVASDASRGPEPAAVRSNG